MTQSFPPPLIHVILSVACIQIMLQSHVTSLYLLERNRRLVQTCPTPRHVSPRHSPRWSLTDVRWIHGCIITKYEFNKPGISNITSKRSFSRMDLSPLAPVFLEMAIFPISSIASLVNLSSTLSIPRDEIISISVKLLYCDSYRKASDTGARERSWVQ